MNREKPIYECPFLSLSAVNEDYLLTVFLAPSATCIKVSREQAVALAMAIVSHEQGKPISSVVDA